MIINGDVNDSIVTECKDDYLKKGIPYILFYKKDNINNQLYNINQIIYWIII